MDAPSIADYYDVLQLSPQADQDTIQRVFRHLAKRFHPDNVKSGDAERFKLIMEAFRVLSDPESRAGYDARHQQRRETRWRIFDQDTVTNNVVADRRIREAILSLLYASRRNDPEHPGVGIVDLERLLGCPEEHMSFHVWYLKENGWIQRLENGMLAITVSGVDRVLSNGGPLEAGMPLLKPLDTMKPASSPNGVASRPDAQAGEAPHY